MITKFQLFERQDIEKAQIIRKASEIITNKLKAHIENAIEKNVEIPCEFNLSPNFDCRLTGDGIGGAAYSLQKDRQRYLQIKIPILINFIDFYNSKLTDIRWAVDQEPQSTTFDQIDWSDIQNVIYHEITHRYDDIKYDLKKISPNLFNIKAKLSGNTEEYSKAYKKQYPNNPAEYNAYFLSAINYLKDDMRNGKYSLPNNFTDFKADFENYIGTNYSSGNNYNFFRNSPKYRKHLNKRIFDLWIKIKEKGIKAL